MNVLIDLDGTLVDPAAGILASFQAGLRSVGAHVPAAADLAWVIGPPLRVSFPQAGVRADRVDAALAAYRANYTGGAMFDAVPYDGARDALAALRDAGHRLFVATSKPHAFARPIVERFGYEGYMSGVYGPELDGTRDDKADLIAHLLARESLAASDCVMIGDRKFDALAARRNGFDCVGVLWGYGDRAELEAAEANPIVEAWREIPGQIAALVARRSPAE